MNVSSRKHTSNPESDDSHADDRKFRLEGRRPREQNHLFVSNVRFWSMLAIFFIHALSAFGMVSPRSHLDVELVAPFKFGTIGFFLISGFLLGERVDRCNPMVYFSRRFQRLFLPWLAWCFMASGLLVSYQVLTRRLGVAEWQEIVHVAQASVWTMLVDSSLWFVPNLLICIAVLLLFRRYLYDLRLGAALLAVNLVYVVNIYKLWFVSKHSEALFAFVFYLWLGSFAARHFDKLSQFLRRVPGGVLVALAVGTGIASYLESRWLVVLGNPEPVNTLRLTNQIFSVCMVLMIFKVSRATWPRFTDVRRHTFGLYLSHPVALILLMHVIRQAHLPVLRSIYGADAEGVVVWLAASAITYSVCLKATMWLSDRPSLQWLVGVRAEESSRHIVVEEALLQRAWSR